ncbi:E3 ubiquitin-protein ligase orthrus [Thalictrum thalictroides]|uniref:RING-type E3 ubiquitin transferase n=1 Tax=Thalictrum thalictroides TaxID=46969 RepID=A0A7J6X801_THATH|nr:E3 ubiquitin-protein ligase orthrus [Thalictrum thalictroides]
MEWDCPDCSSIYAVGEPSTNIVSDGQSNGSDNLIAAIRAIEADESLTEQQKNKKRQLLMNKGKGVADLDDDDHMKDKAAAHLYCVICIMLPERPITTPCGHNFCLKCFQKWTSRKNLTCPECRGPIPRSVASQPRINAAAVVAIRMAKTSKLISSEALKKVHHFVHNQERPDKAFTTERAKKTGKANACSGKIFVTVPPDHFGPILAENDPDRKKGVLVGEVWEDRMECRQWGAHLPHVAGIAGQSEYGAQSVALSGGYEDDEDHGEWFLYTGSGGRDLSGNKRTNKYQAFDQKFDKMNEALRVSCKKGYPVRVVRSHKEKRSSYAPSEGVRYDGVYRIEKCWRKIGKQEHKVCRYLFVRCDNEPAPWSSDEHGDRPRSLPVIEELKAATDLTERKEDPSWDYDEEESCWKWKRSPPLSRRTMDTRNPEDKKGKRKAKTSAENLSGRDRLLKGLSCTICRNIMRIPVTAACGHSFCKSCLEVAFSGQTFVRERTCAGRRNLRAQKIVMKCPDPQCQIDISESIKNPQVNRGLMGTIESLKLEAEDDSKVVQNPPENKAKSVYKRRKTNNVPLLSNPDGVGKDDKSSEEQKSKSVSGGTEDEMEVESSTTSESNLKTTATKDSSSSTLQAQLNDDDLE